MRVAAPLSVLLVTAALVSPAEAGAAAGVPAEVSVSAGVRTTSGAPGRTFVVRNEKQLRRAVARSNRLPGKDKIKIRAKVIRFGPGPVKGGPKRGDLDIRDDLVIDGGRPGGGRALIDARGRDRILDIGRNVNDADHRVVVKRLRLKNGDAPGSEPGGAIRASGGLLIVRKTLISNSEAKRGGAIVTRRRLKVQDSTLRDSTAEFGGLISGGSGSLEITLVRTILRGGRALDGGAFHTVSTDMSVIDGRIILNVAKRRGGGLFLDRFDSSTAGRSNLSIEGTRFARNRAGGDESTDGGGGLFLSNEYNVDVDDSTFIANSATGSAGSGGAILSVGPFGPRVSVASSTFERNTAVRAGGAFEGNEAGADFEEVDFIDNRAAASPGNGGAIHVTGDGDVSYSGGRLLRNEAADEGGGVWNGTGAMVLTGVTIGNGSDTNRAPTGPTAFNDGGTMIVNGRPVLAGDGF